MKALIFILTLFPSLAFSQNYIFSRSSVVKPTQVDGGVAVEQGSNSTLSFRLGFPPAGSVSIYLTYSQEKISIDPDTLVFTAANYSDSQSCTVSRGATADTTWATSGIDSTEIEVSFSDGSYGGKIHALSASPNLSVDSFWYHGTINAWDTLAISYNVESDFFGSDYSALRDTVISFLYPGGGVLPGGGVDSAYYNVDTARYANFCDPSGFINYDSMNVYVTEGNGYKHFLYHIVPHIRKNEVVFVSAGHTPIDSTASSWDYPAGAQSNNYPIICSLLVQHGYDVVFSLLPLGGQNFGPVYTHNGMDSTETASFNPVSAFLTPWIKAKNTLSGFSGYHVTGLSGGGWVATVLPAIDTGFSCSFQVAGTAPIYVRNIVDDESYTGDYEQGSEPGTPIYDFLRNTCSYLDLYVLAAQNRGHYHLINLTDDCCFWGRFWQTWYRPVKVRAARENGTYTIYEYTSAYHQYTVEVARYIVNQLNTAQAP